MASGRRECRDFTGRIESQRGAEKHPVGRNPVGDGGARRDRTQTAPQPAVRPEPSQQPTAVGDAAVAETAKRKWWLQLVGGFPSQSSHHRGRVGVLGAADATQRRGIQRNGTNDDHPGTALCGSTDRAGL